MPYGPPLISSDSSFLLTPPPSPRDMLEYPTYPAVEFKPAIPGLPTLSNKRFPDLANYGSFARGAGGPLRWTFPQTAMAPTTHDDSSPTAIDGRWVRFPDSERGSETRFISWDQDSDEDEGWTEWDEQWEDFDDEWDEWDQLAWEEYEEADSALENQSERREPANDENMRPQQWIQYGVVSNNVRRTVISGATRENV